MDTTTSDLKGCSIGTANTEEGGSLTNGQVRETDVPVELRNGCTGVGVGYGISNDEKGKTASVDITNGGKEESIQQHDAQVFADHGT